MKHKRSTPVGLLILALSLSMLVLPLAARKVAADRAVNPDTSVPGQRVPGRVRLSIDQIPTMDSPMPVLRLSAQKAPEIFLRRFLGTVAPQARALEPLAQNKLFAQSNLRPPESLSGAFDGDHLAAYADNQTGDAQVFPAMSRLKPMEAGELERAVGLARQLFAQEQLLGKDDTRVEFLKPLALYGQNASHGGGRVLMQQGRAQGKALLLAYVRLRRFVEKYPVYGPGSRALLVVGSGGSLQGFMRRWKTGASFDRVTQSRSREEVARNISAQLEPLTRLAEVEVQNVELAYYDGNQNFLQPVYRFTARILQTPARDKRTDDDLIIGFVPVGKEYEPLPNLAKGDGPNPSAPKAPTGVRPVRPISRPLASNDETMNRGDSDSLRLEDPVVARYVVRNDYIGWVNSANAFWGGLAGSPTGPLFTNAQYYWAEPRLFTNEAWFFINTAHVALTEVHGNWWFFTTLRNDSDGVDITTYTPPGYGAVAGGSLCYWIIHSCEVIPAPDDTAQWPDPWWNVFGGLHSALGYRTVMYIDDGVAGPYGSDIGWVAPAVSAWLNETAASSAYYGNPTAPNHDGINKPMGRGATISMCGREDDSVFNTSAQPSAGCLRIFWWPD